jgi:hypothetical protein
MFFRRLEKMPRGSDRLKRVKSLPLDTLVSRRAYRKDATVRFGSLVAHQPMWGQLCLIP